MAARSNAVRVANLLHYRGQVYQTLEALQRVSAAAPTRSVQQLAEIEQRLEASVRDSGRWRTRLADDFADLSRLMREDIGREEMDLRFRYERDIQRWDEARPHPTRRGGAHGSARSGCPRLPRCSSGRGCRSCSARSASRPLELSGLS
ncbi:MAG: hypothetical protein ACXVHC_02315 [Frankiaceae bacterium]